MARIMHRWLWWMDLNVVWCDAVLHQASNYGERPEFVAQVGVADALHRSRAWSRSWIPSVLSADKPFWICGGAFVVPKTRLENRFCQPAVICKAYTSCLYTITALQLSAHSYSWTDLACAGQLQLKNQMQFQTRSWTDSVIMHCAHAIWLSLIQSSSAWCGTVK